MAELTTNTRQPRVDMTPMVDLGFLLITFFVFTTTFSSNVMMKLNMPDDKGPKSIIKNGNSLTLILEKENRIFWHQKDTDALNAGFLSETSYGKTLRQLIVDRRKKAIDPENFTVIIRPTDASSYKNTVDVLDEMVISKQEHFAIADVSPKEVALCEAKIK